MSNSSCLVNDYTDSEGKSDAVPARTQRIWVRGCPGWA